MVNSVACGIPHKAKKNGVLFHRELDIQCEKLSADTEAIEHLKQSLKNMIEKESYNETISATQTKEITDMVCGNVTLTHRQFATPVDKCNHLQKADLGNNALRYIGRYLGNPNSKRVYEGRYNREYTAKISTTDKMSLPWTPTKYDSKKSSTEDSKRKTKAISKKMMKNTMRDIKAIREDQKEYREEIAMLKKESRNIKKDNAALRQKTEKIKEIVIILEINKSERMDNGLGKEVKIINDKLDALEREKRRNNVIVQRLKINDEKQNTLEELMKDFIENEI
ncbi:hypothetical protein FQA39_LY12103 [Lamprigera yunnana]|nr:hypothetical protein FQA39_LY12103 [Lamprigera yunnana]